MQQRLLLLQGIEYKVKINVVKFEFMIISLYTVCLYVILLLSFWVT